MKYQCPHCGAICNFKSSSGLKRCGKCNFIIEGFSNCKKSIYCTDCNRKHIFSNDERFIRCECGNVIINSKFQPIINPEVQPIKRKSIFEKNLEDVPFFKFIGTYIITPLLALLFIGGCITTCRKIDQKNDEKRMEKSINEIKLKTAHMIKYHPYISADKLDPNKVKISPFSGKIDCDYCDRLNKIKGNYND